MQTQGSINAAVSSILALALGCLVLPLFGASRLAAQQSPDLPESGTTNVTGYYQFLPLEDLAMGDLGVHGAHALHGVTHNANGEPFFDKMTARCVVHRQPVGDDHGFRYSCAWADADGNGLYFLGEDHTGEGGPPKLVGGTGKYQGIDAQIPKLDVQLVFAPENKLDALIVDYEVSWRFK